MAIGAWPVWVAVEGGLERIILGCCRVVAMAATGTEIKHRRVGLAGLNQQRVTSGTIGLDVFGWTPGIGSSEAEKAAIRAVFAKVVISYLYQNYRHYCQLTFVRGASLFRVYARRHSGAES